MYSRFALTHTHIPSAAGRRGRRGGIVCAGRLFCYVRAMLWPPGQDGRRDRVCRVRLATAPLTTPSGGRGVGEPLHRPCRPERADPRRGRRPRRRRGLAGLTVSPLAAATSGGPAGSPELSDSYLRGRRVRPEMSLRCPWLTARTPRILDSGRRFAQDFRATLAGERRNGSDRTNDTP